MITKFQLRTREDAPIGYLNKDDLSVFKRTYAINGQHALDINTFLTHEYAAYFLKYNKILFYDDDNAKWYEFIISAVDETDEFEIYCESSIYELSSCLNASLIISGNTVLTGLAKILEESYPRSNWNVGTTDIVGNFDMSHIKKSTKFNVYAWAEKVGGEVVERIEVSGNTVTRYIDIVSRIGSDRGIVKYDDRDLSNFKKSIPEDDYFTACFAYGQINNEIQLDISNVEWSIANGDPVDKPLGQAYIALSDTIKNTYGLYADGYQHRFTAYENTQQIDAAILLQEAYDFLIANLLDKTGYTLKASDIDEEIICGDTVGLVIIKNNIRFKGRIIKAVIDYLDRGNNTFEFNFKQRYIYDTIKQALSTAEEAKIAADNNYISSVRDRLNSEIETDQTFNSFTVEDGLLSLNAATYDAATLATSIKGGSIRIANSKTGETFNFTTILTGAGILADAITTGIIRGENFDIDLNAGIFRFGTRINGVISEENTVTQWTVDGFTLVGAEVSAIVTNTAIKFINAINGNTIAEFTTAGLRTPTAIVETVLQVGKARFQKDGNDLGILLND